MNAVDKNQSGQIDYSEFVMASINKNQLLAREKLEMTFRMFDKDGSGDISTKELKETLGNNQFIQESVWKDMLNEVD